MDRKHTGLQLGLQPRRERVECGELAMDQEKEMWSPHRIHKLRPVELLTSFPK